MADVQQKFDSRVSYFSWLIGTTSTILAKSGTAATSLTDINMPLKYRINDGTVFGDTGESPLPSIYELHFTVKGWMNQATDGNVLTSIFATHAAASTATFIYGPTGTTSGNTKITATVYVPNFTITARVGSIVTFEAECWADNVASTAYTVFS